MNLKVVLGLILLLPVATYAQPPESTGSTLTVYSDNHERFVLVLDGKEQGNVAKDDIKLVGLDKPVYEGKIIFEDKSLPILLADMRVTTPNGARADAYYNIRRTLDGSIELHFLSVVPINNKYLSNDVKYFAHKGGYGGDFIDYTAPITKKTTTHTEVINGQNVVVSSSNTGFDLSGKPIKDKDVKFIDYSAPQAKESSMTTTTRNANGELITTTSKKITPHDTYGNDVPATTSTNTGSIKRVEDPELYTYDHKEPHKEVIIASEVTDRPVVKNNVTSDYMNIQNSSLTEDQLSNLSKVRSDISYDPVYTNTKVPVIDPTPAARTTVVTQTPTVTVAQRPSTPAPAPVTSTTTTTKVTQGRSRGLSQTTTTVTTETVAQAPSVTMVTASQPASVTISQPSAPITTAPVTAPVTTPVAETVAVTPPVETPVMLPAATPVATITTTGNTQNSNGGTITTTDTRPVTQTSDAKALTSMIYGAADNTTNAGTGSANNIPESKHAKGLKKLFNSMSSYNEDQKAAPATPVSDVDTTIENGKMVIMTPTRMVTPTSAQPDPPTMVINSAPAPVATISVPAATTITTPAAAPATTAPAVVTTTPVTVAMDGNSTPYVNSATYEGYNSDGTRRVNNSPCPNPMDVPSFDEAKADISALPDDGTKIQTAIMLENSYCFTAQQVFELCMLFTSEHTKLEFAKTSYSKTVDPSNYFKVNNAFQEDASVKELKDFLDKTK